MKTAEQLHEEACQRGERYYLDPMSGYRVFTAVALRKAKKCCGCGCRHCPYGHLNVSAEKRAMLHRDPWYQGNIDTKNSYDIIFWSGGKDSFLALQHLQRERVRPCILCTTFDGHTDTVAHQDLSLQQLQQQQQALGLPMLLVPLYPGEDYITRLSLGLRMLQNQVELKRLVFGDLHLEHIRSWREKIFAEAFDTLECYFPLWHASYDELFQELMKADVTCRISAVVSDTCKDILTVGDVYDAALLEKLPDAVDPFGENGEFHTYVELPAD